MITPPTRAAVPVDPVGSYFDPYGLATPSGEWEYDLAETAVHYGPGWWPFYRTRKYPGEPEKDEPVAVRIAPDTEFLSWRNEYVTLEPGRADPAQVTAHLHLYVRSQCLGAVCVDMTLRADLRAKVVHLAPECPDTMRAQAEAKGGRILRFLLHHRACRRAGHTCPVTDHDKWLTAQDLHPRP